MINQLTLKEGDYIGLSRWIRCNPMAFKSERGRQRDGDQSNVTGEEIDPLLPTLKTEENATSQGMQVAFRSWKRQGSRFSPEENEFSSRASGKEPSSADTDLTRWDPV